MDIQRTYESELSAFLAYWCWFCKISLMKTGTCSVWRVSDPDLLIVFISWLRGLVEGGTGGELDGWSRYLRDDDPHPLNGGREIRGRCQIKSYFGSYFWRRGLPHNFSSIWWFSLVLGADVNLGRLFFFLWTSTDCDSRGWTLFSRIFFNFGDLGFGLYHGLTAFKVECWKNQDD